MGEHGGEPGGSFEDRLKQARLKQGMDVPSPAASQGEASALSIGLRVVVELVSAIAVAVAIGWGLDRWLHTRPLFMLLFVLLGGAAGVMNLWRTLRVDA